MSGNYHHRNWNIQNSNWNSNWNNGYQPRRFENGGNNGWYHPPHRQPNYGNGSSSRARPRSREPSRRSRDRRREPRGYEISPLREKAPSPPPANSTEVPEARHSEPPAHEKVDVVPPTDGSVEIKRKSRKRSRHSSESSDDGASPEKDKNLSQQQREQRQQAYVKKLSENSQKIVELHQCRTKKQEEKEVLSTEMGQIREEISGIKEECKKKKMDLQMKKEKQVKRGTEAKKRLAAGIGKMEVGEEMTGLEDTQDWLDVLKEVKEAMLQCKSEEEEIGRLESDVVQLQVLLEEKEKMMGAVVEEVRALDKKLAKLYSEITPISEESTEFHGGQPHRKRSKKSKRDREESTESSVVHTKNASQLLNGEETDATNNSPAATDDQPQQVEEEAGNSEAQAQDQRLPSDSLAPEADDAPQNHSWLLDHDYLKTPEPKNMGEEPMDIEEEEDEEDSGAAEPVNGQKGMEPEEVAAGKSHDELQKLQNPSHHVAQSLEVQPQAANSVTSTSEGSQALEKARDAEKTVDDPNNGASSRPNEGQVANIGQGPDNTVSNAHPNQNGDPSNSSTQPGLLNFIDNGRAITGIRVPLPIPLLDPSEIKEEVIDEVKEEAASPSEHHHQDGGNATHETIMRSDGAQWTVSPSRAAIPQSVTLSSGITEPSASMPLDTTAPSTEAASVPTPVPRVQENGASRNTEDRAYLNLLADAAIEQEIIEKLPGEGSMPSGSSTAPPPVTPTSTAGPTPIALPPSVAPRSSLARNSQKKQSLEKIVNGLAEKVVEDASNQPSSSETSSPNQRASTGSGRRGRKSTDVQREEAGQQGRGGPQLRSRKK